MCPTTGTTATTGTATTGTATTGTTADLVPGGTVATAEAALASVTAVYDAFGRGDVPGLLELLSAEVLWDADWLDNHAQRAGIAHLGPRRGPAEVAEFFEHLGTWQIHDFQVLDLMVGRRHVAARILIDATLPAGGRLTDEEIHLWTIDGNGRVAALRHYVDTAKHIVAAGAGRPEAAH